MVCTKWLTRDVVGYFVDTIEGYFMVFDVVCGGTFIGELYGLFVML